jgi:translation initiation factor IF-1
MVKNICGGKGSKGLARKNEGGGGGGRLRTSANAMEVYAVVSQALGNGMFYVRTITGLRNILMRVRGKFAGKNKRNNLVSIGSYVLVGLRDYEAPHYKNTDLLELYSDSEVKQLAALPMANAGFFYQTTSSASNHEDLTSAVVFTNDFEPPIEYTEAATDNVAMEDEIDINDI